MIYANEETLPSPFESKAEYDDWLMSHHTRMIFLANMKQILAMIMGLYHLTLAFCCNLQLSHSQSLSDTLSNIPGMQ
jgi:ribosomal protein S10